MTSEVEKIRRAPSVSLMVTSDRTFEASAFAAFVKQTQAPWPVLASWQRHDVGTADACRPT
jgi:hypothetical protein